MVSKLRECGVAERYRSGSGGIVADFVEQCLGATSRYDCTLGYVIGTSPVWGGAPCPEIFDLPYCGRSGRWN